MELKNLVGAHKLHCSARTDVRHPFDSDKDGIAWSMDNKIYIVFEDNNDGYRSQAGPLLVADGDAYDLWSPEYIERDVVVRLVTRTDMGEAEIIEAIDVKTGHTWMRVGTENIDDYYPSFIAEWHPMAGESPE